MCDDPNISRSCQAMISGPVEDHTHRLGNHSPRSWIWHVCHDLIFSELVSALPDQTNQDAACQGGCCMSRYVLILLPIYRSAGDTPVVVCDVIW